MDFDAKELAICQTTAEFAEGPGPIAAYESSTTSGVYEFSAEASPSQYVIPSSDVDSIG